MEIRCEDLIMPMRVAKMNLKYIRGSRYKLTADNVDLVILKEY